MEPRILKASYIVPIQDIDAAYEREDVLPHALLGIFSSLEFNNIVSRETAGLVLKSRDSLANDIHNLASITDLMFLTMAAGDSGRALLHVSILFEAYLTTLRSMLDLVAPLIQFGLDEAVAKQVPTKSLYDLIAWVENPNNHGRIPEGLVALLTKYKDALVNVREIRNHIVHNGGEPTVKRDEHGSLVFAVYKGRGEYAKNLAQDVLGTDREEYPLIPYLSYITQEVFNFQWEVADELMGLFRHRYDSFGMHISGLTGVCMPSFRRLLATATERE